MNLSFNNNYIIEELYISIINIYYRNTMLKASDSQ
jgi:hypothetical protein